MKITNERLIEILKDNWYISDILQYPSLEVKFSTPIEEEENIFIVQMYVTTNDYISDIRFKVNAKRYDEALSDVEKYEVEDMGLTIGVDEGDELFDFDFNLESIWRILFFNKEKRF